MKKTLAIALLLASAPAFAHTGHGAESVQAGILHPLTGLDHLLMLLGSGILAALTGRSLALPLATIAALAFGALLGQSLGSLPGMEAMILLSLLVAGIAMLTQRARGWLAAILPVLALAHGWAHGVEAGEGAFAGFAAGFLLASSTLLSAGYAAGVQLRRIPTLQKLAGTGLLASAAVLIAG